MSDYLSKGETQSNEAAMKETTNEGLMIAVTVVLILIGAVGAWFLLKWIVQFFFPTIF